MIRIGRQAAKCYVTDDVIECRSYRHRGRREQRGRPRRTPVAANVPARTAM